MLSTIAATLPKETGYPDRVAALSLLRAVLDGTLYEGLKYDFHEDSRPTGEYVPVSQRRPSVRYNLCKIVVNDSVSVLFGNGRFPAIRTGDPAADAIILDVVDETGLSEVMQEAAFRGSIGSIAILTRVLEGRLFFDVLDTAYLTPEWEQAAPDTLKRVTEKYKVLGKDVAAMGYPVLDVDLGTWWWFQRAWDADAETWFTPWKTTDFTPPVIDEAKTTQHGLGFVPIVWIKNLSSADPIDGACTFAAAIETQIEIEYQLSQAGRGLKYSSDPLLLIKEVPAAEGARTAVIRSSSNALTVDAKGDAKLLEINGSASEAVIGYVRALREMALETIHGNRSNADKISAAQSGRALEMLHQPLIWLADKLRTSYGTRGLLPLVRMVIKARQKFPLIVYGEKMPELSANLRPKLVWPPWFAPTALDCASEAARVSGLYGDGLLSRETAVTALQPANGIANVEDEIKKIDADTTAKDARAAALGAQVKASETLPA